MTYLLGRHQLWVRPLGVSPSHNAFHNVLLMPKGGGFTYAIYIDNSLNVFVELLVPTQNTE
jgi:hypothetical protein